MYGAPVGTINVTSTGQLLTYNNNTDGNIGVDYKCRIFNIHLISSSTASVLTISNGISGSVFIKVTGTISTGVTFDFGINGVVFSSGAYITVDANIVSATIACRADAF